MTKPEIFLVGAPKCGTTSMCAYLGQHPEIFVPRVKEPFYFGSDLKGIHIPRSQEEYLDLFSDARGRMACEGSTWYLYSQVAASEIAAFNQNARILVMLRNPVEMLPSYHNELLFATAETLPTLEEALDAEELRQQGQGIPANCWSPELLRYSEVARYAPQVRRYLDVFGPDQVSVLIFDDFKKDPLGVFRHLLRFLGARDDFQPCLDVKNPSKFVRSPSLHRFINNQRVQRFAQCVLPPGPRSKINQAYLAINRKFAERRPLPLEARQRIALMYKPDIDQLSDMLSRDLSAWYRREFEAGV